MVRKYNHAKRPTGLMAKTEVRPRVERRTTNAHVAAEVPITAEDDGGICGMRRLEHGWIMKHPYLALLKAKKAFKHIRFDEKTGDYIPIVSKREPGSVSWRRNDHMEGNRKFLQHVVHAGQRVGAVVRLLGVAV
jgi:hypothetical protein